MGKQLYGSDADIKAIFEIATEYSDGKDLNKAPYLATLPVSVPGIKGQRRTKASRIRKWLEQEKGFNWSLWRYPSIVRVPESNARAYQSNLDPESAEYMEEGFLGDGFWYGRWDGDHRTHIYRVAFPQEKKYECMVYPVSTVEQANDLFVKIQALRQAGLTAEDQVINQWLSGDPAAMKTADDLDFCGLALKNGECIMPESATTDTPSTRYRLFDRSVKHAGLHQTKMAVDILKVALGQIPKWNHEISPTLMYGLALLFKHRLGATQNTLGKELQRFICRVIETTPNQNKVVTHWCRAGGDKHNREAESLALGIAETYNDAVKGGTYRHKIPGGLRKDLGLGEGEDE